MTLGAGAVQNDLMSVGREGVDLLCEGMAASLLAAHTLDALVEDPSGLDGGVGYLHFRPTLEQSEQAGTSFEHFLFSRRHA